MAAGELMRPLVVIGDALLDRDVVGAVERLSPDAPVPVVDEAETRTRPGGAGLAAMLAAADGRAVTLITALARDDAAAELAAGLRRAGVEIVDLGLDGTTPEKVRVVGRGRPLLRLDRGSKPGVVGRLGAGARAAIGWAEAVLVSDYGRGVTSAPGMADALTDACRRGLPLVWDPHPRGREPVPGARLATPNVREAEHFAPEPAGDGLEALIARAGVLARRWQAGHVAVTRGMAGALLVSAAGTPLAVPAVPSPGADPCGAGDRFASAAAALLADGAEAEDAVIGAVARASAFVAAGGGEQAFQLAAGGPPAEAAGTPRPGDAELVATRVRAAGGTVVATGGCFDLLHAGHVATLEAARALGDCLVVCLNDDDSVRRLKGPGRPLVPVADRATVLLALGSVDAVAIFGENTPEALLERLRPDVWAKGGDYRSEELPERAVVERHGGRVVALPYIAGRSTTKIIAEAGADAG